MPDAVNADLERWASIKGQPKAGIAAYLIERGVENAKDKGELPRQSSESETVQEDESNVKPDNWSSRDKEI
ncbi:MAG: hypothetical protein MJA27_21150 [Pseudanabaenales cyanobacterium]|nr:hypothetical protein [Pseudanabaenales cyanobacterium]